MLKTGIFILALIYCTFCQAQYDTISDSCSGHFNLKFAYISSLIYPGLSSGIEFPLPKLNVNVLNIQKPFRSFKKGRFISASLNWYHHPGFHDNLYLTAEWVMRRTRNKGFISEFSVGPGFSRTFLGGTTYRVDDRGNISVVKLAGYNYALITIGGGLGYDFTVKKQLPVSGFAKMNLILMFPYNSTLYFRPVLEIGIRYTPGRSKNNVNKGPVAISK
jgi:hypothetical protein